MKIQYIFILLIVIVNITVFIAICTPVKTSENSVFHHTHLINNYYAGFNASDLSVRQCSSTKECKQRMYDSLRMPRKDEYVKLDKACKIVDAVVAKTFKLLNTIPWKIIVFDNQKHENAFPHTHADTIIMPTSSLDSPNLASTLLHEKVHIFQRIYPLQTNDLILNYMHMHLGSPRYKHNHIKMRRNPDINEIIYRDQNNENIMPLYLENPKTLTDIKDTRDHPYEIMAYTIQNMYIPVRNKDHYKQYFHQVAEWLESL